MFVLLDKSTPITRLIKDEHGNTITYMTKGDAEAEWLNRNCLANYKIVELRYQT